MLKDPFSGGPPPNGQNPWTRLGNTFYAYGALALVLGFIATGFPPSARPSLNAPAIVLWTVGLGLLVTGWLIIRRGNNDPRNYPR